MELALLFSLAGVIITIFAIIAVTVVFINADYPIIKNIKKNKITILGNMNDFVRFRTTLLPTKLLGVTEETQVNENYGKITTVNNKTDDEMKEINVDLIINSVNTTAPNVDNLIHMNTKILNNTGRDIRIQFVSCCPDLFFDNTENIMVNTYFKPTVIKNGAITNFPIICLLSKSSSEKKFVVDLSLSDKLVKNKTN
uniref:Wsv421-like protein n=1 Tax=Metopaulias depressus WSSV-like virus TaxID=1675544 RepID=A0A0K0VLL2_9VIRU|nr:wsv421-like protein [Metopaulias depressus WSSV-like virus]